MELNLLRSGSFVTVGRDVSRQLFDLSIEVSHLTAEFIRMNAENIVSARAFDENPHRVTGEIRYASSAGR